MADEYDRGEKEPLRNGVKIRAKLKRGTGTRDQDTLVIEARGEDSVEASQMFNRTLQNIEDADVQDRLRALQPDEPEVSEDA